MVALKGLPAKTFGMMLTMEPVIGALSAAMILKEQLSVKQWLAIVCIMIASAGSAATAALSPPPEAKPDAATSRTNNPQIPLKNNIERLNVNPEIVKAFAPTGVLRASLNVGNPVLANLDAQGKPVGISIDLAQQLGKRLGVPVELIVNETAGKSVATVESGRADIGFFAVDPERGKEISFTEAYVLIEGYYLVREDSHIKNNAQVDVAHNRVVVGKGSAYDLFLTRHLKHAEIIRAPSSQAVVQTFLDSGIEVAAGVKQQLQADTRDVKGVRMLDDRFMVIRQAMGVPKNRGPQAALFLRTFVEDMKAQGIARESMLRHGIQGADIAPAANPGIDPLSVQ
jgi:polar amino acid transport system substrate-binding protein